MPVSSLPTSKEIEPDLLELLGDEKEWRTGDIAEALADCYSLTPEQRAEKYPSSGQPVFYHRCNWARLDMTKAGLVESPGSGYWQITQRGLDVLAGSVQPPRRWHDWKPPNRG